MSKKKRNWRILLIPLSPFIGVLGMVGIAIFLIVWIVIVPLFVLPMVAFLNWTMPNSKKLSKALDFVRAFYGF